MALYGDGHCAPTSNMLILINFMARATFMNAVRASSSVLAAAAQDLDSR